MASIETAFAWSQLSESEQLSEWTSFLDHLDAGDAGYHRAYAVLMPLWISGEVPLGVGSRVERGERTRSAVAEHVLGRDRLTTDEVDQLLGPPPF